MNTSIILHELIAQIETENMIIGNTSFYDCSKNSFRLFTVKHHLLHQVDSTHALFHDIDNILEDGNCIVYHAEVSSFSLWDQNHNVKNQGYMRILQCLQMLFKQSNFYSVRWLKLCFMVLAISSGGGNCIPCRGFFTFIIRLKS